MKALASDGDWERAHSKADDLLCKVLSEYGEHELVAAWSDVGKWYA
jgi:hypothetical protein